MPTDYKSGMPVRSEKDGLDERVHVKIVDGTTTAVNQMTVDSDQNAHVEIHGNDPANVDRVVRTSEEGHISTNGIYHATSNTDPANMALVGHERNASIGDAHSVVRLSSAAPSVDDIDYDTVQALDVNAFMHGYDTAAGKWDRFQLVDGKIVVSVDGVYHVTNNADPDNVGLIGHVRNATPGDTHQTNRLTSIQNSTVVALDVSLHDEAGDAYSLSNPLPVTYTDGGGDDVHDYQTDADVAKDASANHNYTVTAGKTLRLKKVQGSSAGRMKLELFIETGVSTGVFVSHGVWFSSTGTPNISEELPQPIEVAAGVIVRLTRTNRDNQPTDLYSFINGSEY